MVSNTDRFSPTQEGSNSLIEINVDNGTTEQLNKLTLGVANTALENFEKRLVKIENATNENDQPGHTVQYRITLIPNHQANNDNPIIPEIQQNEQNVRFFSHNFNDNPDNPPFVQLAPGVTSYFVTRANIIYITTKDGVIWNNLQLVTPPNKVTHLKLKEKIFPL